MLVPGRVEASSLSCSLCRDEIRGRYHHYDEIRINVCMPCAESPSCAQCALPMTGPLVGSDRHCSRCVANAPRCVSCGLAIFERYWTMSGQEGKYCHACTRDGNECGACHAPVRNGVFRDGRVFCHACGPSLVTDERDYEELYDEMVTRAEKVLGLELDERPALRVESVAVLGKGPMNGNVPDGLCGLYQRDHHGNTSIHVLSHMTRSRVSAVLAHELAHAWQAENCPDAQGSRIREGFAEWVAWKLLEGLDGGEAERQLIESRIDDYGRGFQVFADLEAERGQNWTIWYARSARNE